MSFLNRSDELRILNNRWQSKRAEFLVLWGRRRVGKTELLNEFLASHRGMMFEASDVSARDQLRDLSTALVAAGGDELLAAHPLVNWEGALTAIKGFVGNQRTVIVLDEFQYLARQTPGLGSTLNRWWRLHGRHLPIMLILAGSEVGFFEKEVLTRTAATYGRRTGQLQILPFHYQDAALFHPRYKPIDLVKTYAVCGGMPYYLEQFDDAVSLTDNIRNHVLSREGVMFEEALLLLSQELSHPETHMSILRAIANGATRNGEIVNRIGISNSSVSQAVRLLERMQLVRRRVPITVPNPDRTKQIVYELTDQFLQFWFRFIAPYRTTLLQRGGVERHLQNTLLPQFDHFVSKPAFESICQQHMQTCEPDSAVGSWWGFIPTGVGRKTEQREIDCVAVDQNRKVVAVGMCKWTNAPISLEVEQLLQRVLNHIPLATPQIRHYFYARTGFTAELKKLAATDPHHYKLIAVEDLYP